MHKCWCRCIQFLFVGCATMTCVRILFISSFVAICCGQLFCSDWLKSKPITYYPLRHCQRSNGYQIGAKNVPSLDKCVEFAENNFALAFNYGHGRKPKNQTAHHNLINLFNTLPVNRSTIEEAEPKAYVNCEILACSEVGNLSTMANDSRYDYYTLYANPIRKRNLSNYYIHV